MAADLLVEIGTEEIPAGFLQPALEGLGRIARQSLEGLRLAHGETHLWGTPRRMAIWVERMEEVQADLEQEITGPPVRAAFDDRGAPTAAAKGFARAQGVEIEDLKVVETSRGPYVAVRRRLEGRPAREVLSSEIPQWITRIPFPKTMRWRDLHFRFARPIHWIVALLGEEALSFRLETIASGRSTRGHRFMSPGEVELSKPSVYLELCRSLHVLVDPEERREVILREARKAAQALSGRLVEDPELVETIVYLVEYPVAVAGDFDPSFLELPREVLITAMREHQKFLSVEDESGRLLPHFVNISNMESDSMELIRRGNERVLKARLSDAEFFFREDRKRRLEDRVEDLRGVIFHSELGTSFEKVRRIRHLAVSLAQELEPDRISQVERASQLSKADLMTEMVGEFPSLQGAMGRVYALLDGEDPEVASAIQEHYLPAYSGDRQPSNAVGALVGIADKMDTLVGCFGVGEIPTGAGDPFGLRRAALGIIHILLHRGYEMLLGPMMDRAGEILGDRVQRPWEEVRADLLSFFRVRLENLWTAQGSDVGAVEAVLAVGFENVPDAFRRLHALEKFMNEEDFQNLALSFKRVLNIVGDTPAGPVDPALFQHPEEAELQEVVVAAEGEVDEALRGKQPLVALQALAALRSRIDRFFDAVLVNVEDERLRDNRLHLLARLGRQFMRLADFSKITTRP